MRTTGSTVGLTALTAVLVGCGTAASTQQVGTLSPAPAAPATATPATGAPAPFFGPGGMSTTYPGGGPAPAPLSRLARRTTGRVTLRTFTQAPSGSGARCDPLNEQCLPSWCEPTGLLVAEVSTEAMAGVRTAQVIGLAPNSPLSLLDAAGGPGPQHLSSGPVPVPAVPRYSDPLLGAAEGSPVQLELVRVAPGVATVRLQTADGQDTAAPTRGLAALAVAGTSTAGRLTALDSRGRPLTSLALPAIPTAAGPGCRPLPVVLPVPGKQPVNAAAAAQAVRAAYATAFTHPTPPQSYAPLLAVEGGSGLRRALDQLRAGFPQAVATSTVSTGRLAFTSPTTAVVQFTLAYSGGAPYSTRNGGAVLRGGSWLVSRGTYCNVLGFGGVTCPGP